MNKWVGLVLLIGLLSACGTDGYTASPVSVRAESGSTVELTGTWESNCYSDSGTDYIQVLVYTGNGRVSIYTEVYSSSDTTCATLDSTTYTATSANVNVEDTKTASGWADGSGTLTSAPGSLSDTPTVSKYTTRLDSGSNMKSIDLIDDATSNWVMYTADPLAAEDVADGYDDYLSTANPLYKQ